MVKWGALVCLLCVSVSAWAQSPSLKVGLNFVSTVYGETQRKATAPDANGAVGPAHVVELINGDFKVYDKKTGKLLLAQSSEAFWEKALGAAVFGENRHNTDPRIVFDPYAKRWYASTQRPAAPTDGEMSVAIARSDTADPLGAWRGVSFFADPDRTPKSGADFDRLGYNRDGIYLSINQFGTRPDGKPSTAGHALFAIKKSDFNQTPPVLTMVRKDHLADSIDATPVIDVEGTSSVGTFWALIQGRAMRTATNDLFMRSDLAGDLTTWKVDRVATTVGDKPGQLLKKIDVPMFISQPGTHAILSFAKRPATNVQLFKGEFWLVQAVAHPDDPKRTAIRWWRIRATDNTVLGEGILSDPTLSLFMPSIAFDTRGHFVIGCAGTSATQPLSAYAISGRVAADKVTFDQTFTLLKAGAAEFAASERWGDYTTTVADPSTPGTFWTFLVAATAKGEWATQVTQLTVTDTAK
jgi:hypothetical protein